MGLAHPQQTWKTRSRHISPFTPLYMAKKVAADWDGAQAELPDWQKHWGDHPASPRPSAESMPSSESTTRRRSTSSSISKKARTRGRSICWPTRTQGRGDEGQWLATKTQILKQPDYALQHAKSNKTIAWYFMKRGEYTRRTVRPRGGTQWFRLGHGVCRRLR